MRTSRSFSFSFAATLAILAGCAVTPAGNDTGSGTSADTHGSEPRVDGTSVVLALPSAGIDVARVELRREYVAADGAVVTQNVAAGAFVEDGALRVALAEPLIPGARYQAVVPREAGAAHVIDVVAPIAPVASPPAHPQMTSSTSSGGSIIGGGIIPIPVPVILTNSDDFYVKKISPAAEGKIERNGASWTRTVTAYFGGTQKVDCSKLPLVMKGDDPATDANVFRVSTRRDNSTATQLMYSKAGATSPGDDGYRGHFSCDSAANTLTFHLPGRLLGGARVVVDVFATATNGYLARRELELRSTDPEILVEMTKFDKDDLSNCEGVRDSDKGWRRCDIYLATVSTKRDASMGADDVESSRHPETDNFGNQDHNEIVSFDPLNFRVYEGPVGDGVDIDIVAYDADSGSHGALSSAVSIIGKIGSAVCAGFGEYCGKDAAKYGDEAHQLVAGVLDDHGKDDVMSKTQIHLRDGGGAPSYWKNWGLDGHAGDTTSYGEPIQLEGEQRVRVYMRVKESAPSWKP